MFISVNPDLLKHQNMEETLACRSPTAISKTFRSAFRASTKAGKASPFESRISQMRLTKI